MIVVRIADFYNFHHLVIRQVECQLIRKELLIKSISFGLSSPGPAPFLLELSRCANDTATHPRILMNTGPPIGFSSTILSC